jgi:hypothetical protein
MRVLILRGDHVKKEDIGKETPAMTVERRVQEQRDAEKLSAANHEEAVAGKDDFEPEQRAGEQTS